MCVCVYIFIYLLIIICVCEFELTKCNEKKVYKDEKGRKVDLL